MRRSSGFNGAGAWSETFKSERRFGKRPVASQSMVTPPASAITAVFFELGKVPSKYFLRRLSPTPHLREKAETDSFPIISRRRFLSRSDSSSRIRREASEESDRVGFFISLYTAGFSLILCVFFTAFKSDANPTVKNSRKIVLTSPFCASRIRPVKKQDSVKHGKKTNLSGLASRRHHCCGTQDRDQPTADVAQSRLWSHHHWQCPLCPCAKVRAHHRRTNRHHTPNDLAVALPRGRHNQGRAR